MPRPTTPSCSSEDSRIIVSRQSCDAAARGNLTLYSRTRTLKKERSRSITQDRLIHCILLFSILCFILLWLFSRSAESNEYSHLSEYGNKSLAAHSFDSAFMVSKSRGKSATIKSQKGIDSLSSEEELNMPQDEVELWMYRQEYASAAEGSVEKRDARQKLDAEIRRREEIDGIINKIADAVFGFEKRTVALTSDRPAGKALVDDWECFESMMGIYEERCGELTVYGGKYAFLFANMCNDGIKENQMSSVAGEVCSGRVS